MESTGGIGGIDRISKEIPKDHFKYLPSIAEEGLGEKNNRKKLQVMFDKYLKPKQPKTEIQKEWGRHFKEGISQISKKDLDVETKFIADIVIYYLYYDIVLDRSKYPKTVPFVDLPIEIIEFLIKKC